LLAASSHHLANSRTFLVFTYTKNYGISNFQRTFSQVPPKLHPISGVSIVLLEKSKWWSGI
jgi:hypothetical protein